MTGDKPWPQVPVGNLDHTRAAVVIIGAGISGEFWTVGASEGAAMHYRWHVVPTGSPVDVLLYASSVLTKLP